MTASLDALGAKGRALYRTKLDEIAAGISPEPSEAQERAIFDRRLSDSDDWRRLIDDRHTRLVLEWNARRLAVADRDVDAIISTHVRGRKVAAWLQDTAEALAEIEKFDLAIDWAKQATDFDNGHQSAKAADYWCSLLAEHQPEKLLTARLEVLHRWPTSRHAHGVFTASADRWDDYHDDVMAILESRSREAVAFALDTLNDITVAWSLAHDLTLDDAQLWERLAQAYEKVDPLAVLPVYTEAVHSDLQAADARRYRSAARRLARMRKLADGAGHVAQVDELIAELRETNRRRPRLQREFDRVGLP